MSQRRRTQKRSLKRRAHKVKGGSCGSCMIQPQVQLGGACPCAAASRQPIILGGVRSYKKNKKHRKTINKRVRFA